MIASFIVTSTLASLNGTFDILVLSEVEHILLLGNVRIRSIVGVLAPKPLLF